MLLSLWKTILNQYLFSIRKEVKIATQIKGIDKTIKSAKI